MNHSTDPGIALPAIPSFKRRMGGVLYDALAVIALWMLASAIVTTLTGVAAAGWGRALLQLLAFATISAYFLWCWTHGGQTLAMKTWRIRLIDDAGSPLGVGIALRRYLLACLGLAAGGLGIWWALWDRDGKFLHDRLCGSRLVLINPD